MKRMSIAAIWPALVLCGSLALASAQSGAQTGVDAVEWEKVQNSATPDAYVSFLEQFPGSEFSAKARAWLRSHIHALHVEAYAHMVAKDEGKRTEKARAIYLDILDIDPTNAMALNNMAFVLYKEFPENQSTSSEQTKKHEKELLDLLERAQNNANRGRTAGERTGIMTKWGVALWAVQPPKKNARSSSLRGATIGNFKTLCKALNVRYTPPPPLGNLHVKGTVVDKDGNFVADQKLWLLEGEADAKIDAAGGKQWEMRQSQLFSKSGKLVNPSTTTDERGVFTFILDSDDANLEPFVDKQLLIAVIGNKFNSNSDWTYGDEFSSQPFAFLMTENNGPFLFQADLVKSEMDLGRMILKR